MKGRIIIIGIIIFILFMIVSCNSTYQVNKGLYYNYSHKEQLIEQATIEGCDIVEDVSCCSRVNLVCKKFTFIHTYSWIGAFENKFNIRYS